MSYFQQIQDRMNGIREVILFWLEAQSDFVVVMADHSDPRPISPFISFKLLTSLRKIGSKDERIIDKVSGKTILRAHREFTIAIEAVGKPIGPNDSLVDFVRATDILESVQMSLDLPTTITLFDNIDLAVISEGEVTDISQLLETETEPRSLLEVEFRARFDLEDDPGYFDKVQFSGGLDTNFDGAENINTGTVDVP